MSTVTESDPEGRGDPDRFVRFLTASVPVLLSYIGPERRFRYANDAYARWFGRSPADIIGKHVREVIGAAAYEAICPFLETALAGQSVTFEREMPYADTEARFVHITYVPDFADCAVRGLAAVVTDITERRRAEEERRQAQGELALVIAGARCLLWHADVFDLPDGRLHWEARFADAEAAQRNFGITPHPGEDFPDAWHRCRVEEDRIRDDANAARQVRAGANYSQEFRIMRSDGSLIWMREDVRVETVAPRRWHLVGVSTDITERRRADVEREQLLQEAQAGVARQRAFLRDVLASVTDGRLRLCDRAEDLPPRLAPVGGAIRLSREQGLQDLRRCTEEAARVQGYLEERCYDLMTAVSEAGMNAISHANGGMGQVYGDGQDRVQVWIEDQGTGITMEQLPRATLARGYSTASTLGHGMKMMFQMVDRIFLLTGPTGTTVVLEQDRHPVSPDWLVI